MIRIGNRKIIQGIKNRDAKTISMIYNYVFPMIEDLVHKNHGNQQDAEDLFQEGMFIIFRKIRKDGLVLKCKFTSFFYTICKNMWIDVLRKRTLDISYSIEQSEDEYVINYVSEIEQKQYELYEKHKDELSIGCREILELHFKGKTIDEIMKITKIKNRQTAKDRKYRCKKKLMESIFNDPHFKALQNELLRID